MTPSDVLAALREAGLHAKYFCSGPLAHPEEWHVSTTDAPRKLRAAWHRRVRARNAITVTDHTGTSHYDLTPDGLAAAIEEMKR